MSRFICVTLLTLSSLFTTTVSASSEEVNVYSYRQPFLVQPMFDKFTEQSGIKVNVVFAKKGLAERLTREGRNSPADLVFTVDIGRLMEVTNKDLVQAVESETLQKNVPVQYRDPENRWFGLTTRTRSIYASKERANLADIQNYEDLSKPVWKGRICTRSGKHPYNLALIASMIAHHGEAEAKTWLQGVKDNLARRPQGNDRAQVKAINEGICDLSLGNNYYFGKMLNDKAQVAWANSVHLTFPNQGNRGTHVNISGVALTKHAPNKESAIKLMEFLTQDYAQSLYAEQNFEYPVNTKVEPSSLVKSWGSFKSDTLPLADIANLRKRAAQLVDEVAFDE
ncbi:iron ABC transporter substrate-binding protein [Oleiphilus sp. HI0081]|nr:iron ABC transporter substrate-binding protein [Oleiphilus sp. HI0043]KZY51036.1 iron ABC transporter substrate-binding protein [Oleiphilus sp. HI0050]KZY74181.1 iron ABC transporter substrate-binding protein [Oleiphilus sp. HI0068]KZY85057.1 iron ABC transporter substrate-binding protein [Oleiphilus sp. HI0069]KZY86017.1 iron ABC transporter substrate-binding protein [Oleiphilus sp. HI0072]KZZ19891.1 iron ABC transporter substrate-binding protein [Oleiphilus sp. HI0078]KZZ21668.1 iron ABC